MSCYHLWLQCIISVLDTDKQLSHIQKKFPQNYPKKKLVDGLSRKQSVNPKYPHKFREACLHIQLHHDVLFSLTLTRHKASFIPSNPLLWRDFISGNPIQPFLSIHNRNPFLPSFPLFVVFSCKLFRKATEIRPLLLSVGIASPEWQANFLLFSS